MAEKVIMPKQGLQMTEGTIIKWLYSEGDKVEKGKPLFEMETDKLTIEIESPATGTLLKIVKGEGQTVPITELIGIIGEKGEDVSEFISSKAEDLKEEEKSNSKDGYDYDVVVIGAGPGGYESAIRCSQLGLKTAVVEKGNMGGTCLNWGCIPTKALLHSAEIYTEAKTAKDYGIKIDDISYDYSKIADKKDKVVKKLRGGVEYLVKSNGIHIFNGTGYILDKNTIKVTGKEENVLSTKNILIATGSRPSKPPINGIDGDRVIDSNGVLAFKEAPESLVIIGGGVIGVEFATIFNSLGKKVTIIEMMDDILPEMDIEISSILRKTLEKKGIQIFTGAKVTNIESSSKKGTCTFEKDGKKEKADGEYVVVAIGRSPNTDNMGLENIGLETDKGFIRTNNYLQTNIENIYAIGDITGKALLAHVASAQGIKAAENMAGKRCEMGYNIIPGCIYTSPEVAAVGLTEKKAMEKGHKIKIGKFPISANGKSMIVGETQGICKIITDEVTGEILGCHIISPRATDMIGEICVAMKSEATIEELADTIHPHPTVNEIILEAAHDVEGMCINKQNS